MRLSRISIFLLVVTIILIAVFLRPPKPCQEPLTYRIGRVDERFGITPLQFSLTVRKAAAVWERALSRELFREDAKGKMDINLIYDYRQETSERLRQLSSRMENTKDSYENMKMRYENLKSTYEQKRTAFESDLNAYNARISAFNAEASSLNRQGGTSAEMQRQRLISLKHELDALRESFRLRQDEIRQLADEINGMARMINETASRQNLDVEQYRDVRGQLGSEFQEGFYESKQGKQSINIYHFDSETKLVRLLVHELGHAMRLSHSDNPNAVMYRLNQGDVAELAADDIAAMKARCAGK